MPGVIQQQSCAAETGWNVNCQSWYQRIRTACWYQLFGLLALQSHTCTHQNIYHASYKYKITAKLCYYRHWRWELPQTRTELKPISFSKTNQTERTWTVWQTEPEPNCQTGRTELNSNTILSKHRARTSPDMLEKLNWTRTHIFSQMNQTERTRTVWQTKPEPNRQTGRTEQNPNFMQWVWFPFLTLMQRTSFSLCAWCLIGFFIFLLTSWQFIIRTQSATYAIYYPQNSRWHWLAVSYLPDWTTATQCCTVLQPAAFTFCTECQTI